MRRKLATVLAMACGLLLLGSVAPTASSAAKLDPEAASARMLVKSDVTPTLRMGRPLTKSVNSVEWSAPQLCNQVNQHMVQGPPADATAAVTLVRGEESGLMQVVYDYGTRAAAVAAFETVGRRSNKQCNQTNALPAAGKKHVQLLSSGEASVAYKGVPGVWTREINGRSPGAVDFDVYSLQLLVGNTVQQFSLAFFDAGRTSDVQRSATDSLALTLAKRWQS